MLGIVWGSLGWWWLPFLAWSFVCMLIGARWPVTFNGSKAGLERIANAALAKAQDLARAGK